MPASSHGALRSSAGRVYHGRPMRLSDFDFTLPAELIAQAPLAARSDARLLHVDRGRLGDRSVRELPTLLRQGDLLVVNDTRVIKARLLGRKLSTGGQVEALVERITGEREAIVQLRASKTPRAGATLVFDEEAAQVRAREGEFYRLEFRAPVLEVLERVGRVPLPPYIDHPADDSDAVRYQTVYAREAGSVAAPTAGLHFDEPLLASLARAGIERTAVTLHVGAGTFQPVRTEDVAQHRMHAERYHVPPAAADAIRRTRERGGRIVAVGTTSLRTLESAARDDGTVAHGSGETALFVTPGYRFRVVDVLLTNFHLPRSTLFMLVCAFGGVQALRQAYAHAIARRYRFFSYGDAMLIERDDAAEAPA